MNPTPPANAPARRTGDSGQPLLKMRGVSFRAAGRRILADLDWVLDQGRHWAVLGANGAGKSTFLRLVRGDIWPAPDGGRRLYWQDGAWQRSPLGFKESAALVSSELLDSYRLRNWNLTSLQVVLSGLYDTHLIYQEPSLEQKQQARATMERLGIAPLARRPVLELSRGQAKKVLLARALVRRPRLLLLDECCEGLDPGARGEVLALVQMAAQDGATLLQATHRPAELVPAVEQALLLERGCLAAQGPREEVVERYLSARRPSAANALPVSPAADYDYVVKIQQARVFLAGKAVLADINWTIRPGENWAVLGPNGAGKTTLLKLLCGDLRPATGGLINWFGSSRRPSLWDLRGRVSLVSAHLQAGHQRRLSGLEVVLSGFQGSIGLHRRPTGSERAAAQTWLENLELEHLAQRQVNRLSYGQVRKLLITRAMVQGPELLLLDEPVAGLDAPSRREVLALIDRLGRAGTTLVMVSHHPEDLVPAISHVARLEQGRLKDKGPRSAQAAEPNSLESIDE